MNLNLDSYLEALKQRHQANGMTANSTDPLKEYGLSGIDCTKCGNTGHLIITRDGIQYAAECDCMKQRRSLRALKNSHMEDMIFRYSFNTYLTPDESREEIKHTAEKFSDSNSGWFFISGRSGSGKTHICSAICRELMYRGAEVRYMLWRDDVTRLKALVNTVEYQHEIRRLKDVQCLYIDDFFKGKVTDADINIAFEIFNARYNDTSLRTVISTELTLGQIMEYDEAIGSRIYERSKEYAIKTPEQNWRLT